MNIKDILSHGNEDFLRAIAGLKIKDWEKSGVTTLWSAKDVLSHLIFYEHLLEDALNSAINGEIPTPYLTQMRKSPDKFEEAQIQIRRDKKPEELLSEYRKIYEKTKELIERIAPEKLQEVGAVSWYGDDYSLENFIIYGLYGHKREHIGQIKVFRKRLGI